MSRAAMPAILETTVSAMVVAPWSLPRPAPAEEFRVAAPGRFVLVVASDMGSSSVSTGRTVRPVRSRSVGWSRNPHEPHALNNVMCVTVGPRSFRRLP